jgi:hypothetical protein
MAPDVKITLVVKVEVTVFVERFRKVTCRPLFLIEGFNQVVMSISRALLYFAL